MVIIVYLDPVFMFGSLPTPRLTPVLKMLEKFPHLWNRQNTTHRTHQLISYIEVYSIPIDLKLIDKKIAKNIANARIF